MQPDPLQRTAESSWLGRRRDVRAGWPVARYSPQTLATEFGEGFILVDAVRYEHLTPRGSTQMFQYSRLMRVF